MTAHVMTTTAPAPARPPAPPPYAPTWVVAARIVGMAVVAVMLCYGALAVVASFMHRERTSAQDITQPVTRLVARTGTGDVHLHAGAAGQPVHVVTTIADSFGGGDSSARVSSGTLTLTGRCRYPWLPDNCHVDYDVTLPAGTSIDVSSGTGDTTADGLSGVITVGTGTGDITLDNLNSATVRAESGTGDVQLDFGTPPTQVSAHSGTGDISVLVPADGTRYRVTTHTGIGDVAVTVPRDGASARSVEAETGTGDIHLATR